jgi:LmbE family N-acetylglucosaminyl deacetylase
MTRRALFLSPHTDDIELSVGGTAAKFVESYEVHVAAFSDATDVQPENLPENTLISEMMRAMDVLGVDKQHVHTFGFRTRYFHSARQEVLDALIRIRDQVRPDIVFAPSTYDRHQDHQVVVNEVLRAFRGSNATILGYEQPWNNFYFETTCFVTLDEVCIAKKLEALAQYESQRHRPYLNEEFIRGLASVGGTQIGSTYAEAFEVMRVIL